MYLGATQTTTRGHAKLHDFSTACPAACSLSVSWHPIEAPIRKPCWGLLSLWCRSLPAQAVRVRCHSYAPAVLLTWPARTHTRTYTHTQKHTQGLSSINIMGKTLTVRRANSAINYLQSQAAKQATGLTQVGWSAWSRMHAYVCASVCASVHAYARR